MVKSVPKINALSACLSEGAFCAQVDEVLFILGLPLYLNTEPSRKILPDVISSLLPPPKINSLGVITNVPLALQYDVYHILVMIIQ